MVPAITLGVLNLVSPGVASAIALPCPLLLGAIGAYIKWRLQAKKRDRHMHELQPMPMPAGQQTSAVLQPTSRPFLHVNTASTGHGGPTTSAAGVETASPAMFHNIDDNEKGLLLTNEQQ